MTAFFTRAVANEGIRLDLELPTGGKSGEWIHVLGIDSDRYRKAETALMRRLIDLAQIKEDAVKDQSRTDEEITLAASLVDAWSFEEPCTTENVITLFREAPQIQKLVDRAAFDRARFFNKDPENSSGTPSPNSG